MKKKLLLGLIVGGFVVLNTQSQSLAATSATQTVTAVLATKKSVVGKGTGLSGTIDADTGVLSALAPSFIISTNKSGAQTLDMTATAPYAGSTPEQAFTNYTGHLGTYIVLANVTAGAQATQAAIQDITSGSVTSNANAIGYPFTPQPTKTGLTLGAWDGINKKWPYTVAQKGDTDVDNAISGSPLGSTYTTDDEPGNYQATITLAFNP